MKKIFSQNQANNVQKSAFDLSHEHKLSGKMGVLMPVLCQEVVPGDKFEINSESMIRFAPMVAPIYHRINSYIHYFYVPNRILWENWEKFITGTAGLTLPTFGYTGAHQTSIADCLGLPLSNSLDPLALDVNDMPLRAFFQIYKDYFIDQNLSTTDPWGGGTKLLDMTFDEFVTENGYEPFTYVNRFLRSWEKDYFTSALPWAQKGNPVNMLASVDYRDASLLRRTDGSSIPDNSNMRSATDSTPDYIAGIRLSDANPNSIQIDNINSVSITVEEMRTATRLQRFLERNARAGTRYVEHLLSHWGVKSSDARLQRAEYLGGGKSPIVISEVLNTTGTAELPQGNMAGHGLNVGRTNHASKYCEEHGFIIGIMSVMPEPNYQNGIPKLWSRKLNLDFYYPEFAQLGEQPILNQEIFWDGDTDTGNKATWGYQSRFAEYKYQPSSVHGHFRDNLDFWHAGRKFATLPALNQEFIECNTTDINERIFAVTDPLAENLYIQVYHNIKALRPMPFYNNPTL